MRGAFSAGIAAANATGTIMTIQVISDEDMRTVTGGVRTSSRSSNRDQIFNALTQLNSTVSSLASQSNNSTSQAMMLMMVALAARRT